MEEYIKLLDLPDEFDLADLKKAYHKKVLQYHPDKASNEAERVGYEALMKKLNEAYDYLKDYLEGNNGKYSKATSESNTYSYSENNYTDDSEYTNNSDENETYQEEEESYQEENEQYNEEENYENIDYTGRITSFIKSMYNPKVVFDAFSQIFIYMLKNPKQAMIIIFISLLSISFWNKILYTESPNDSKTYTKESQKISNQENTRQTPIQNTAKNLDINQQGFQDDSKDIVFKGVAKSELNNYIADLNKQIKFNWVLPTDLQISNPKNIKVIVQFKISKDGSLANEPVIKESSGFENVDFSCIKAIKLTFPFKSLPTGLTDKNLNIEYTFEAQRRFH